MARLNYVCGVHNLPSLENSVDADQLTSTLLLIHKINLYNEIAPLADWFGTRS